MKMMVSVKSNLVTDKDFLMETSAKSLEEVFANWGPNFMPGSKVTITNEATKEAQTFVVE